MPGKNKGDRGQWVENQVGLNLSSNLNDFEDGELKTFKNGQTVAVTMLNHCLKEIIESVSYNDSNVGKKLRHVLIAKFSEKNGKSVMFHNFCKFFMKSTFFEIILIVILYFSWK